jgi:hypothetical protein
MCVSSFSKTEKKWRTYAERLIKYNFDSVLCWLRSRDSSVGIATRYGLEGPVIESRWGEIFHTYPDRLRGPPSLLYNGYRVFPGDKGGRGVMLTTHTPLVPRLRKSWTIPPLALWVLLGLLRDSAYLFTLLVRWRTQLAVEDIMLQEWMLVLFRTYSIVF